MDLLTPGERQRIADQEKQTLLVLDEILSQVGSLPENLNNTGAARDIDFSQVTDSLRGHNIPSIKCKRLWESSKRRLRDF